MLGWVFLQTSADLQQLKCLRSFCFVRVCILLVLCQFAKQFHSCDLREFELKHGGRSAADARDFVPLLRLREFELKVDGEVGKQRIVRLSTPAMTGV